jgi:hypothetical protein
LIASRSARPSVAAVSDNLSRDYCYIYENVDQPWREPT